MNKEFDYHLNSLGTDGQHFLILLSVAYCLVAQFSKIFHINLR